MKEFADNNFKVEKYGRKLSKRVENTVGKGEIACYEQFLLFPPCFQKACFPVASKGIIVWEWVVTFMTALGFADALNAFSQSRTLFYTPAKQMFSWVYWNQPVCLSMCVQNTGNFCHELLQQFCGYCIESRYIDHILVLCKTVFNHPVPIVQGLSILFFVNP